MRHMAQVLSADLRFDPDFFRLIVGSYARLVGKPLLAADQDGWWLYNHAPFALVAQNADPDPRFVYANRTAQGCFEYSWREFTALPSRLSVEAPEGAERRELLDAVARDGFASGYQGIWISKSGRRFRVDDGVVWQLIGHDGRPRGQAATFSSWSDV